MHFSPQLLQELTKLKPAHETKIIVGMSGGVDSSVSAYLLKQAGFIVEGLFMKNWDEDDGTQYCTAIQDLADAQQVADKLEIPLHTANFAHEYWENVFEHFLFEYKAGRTPNPDILCNKEIKFKAFLDYARHLGADKIATGHYAQVHYLDEPTSAQLVKGLDQNKDQSYFLHAVSSEQLAHAVFPIGHLEKQVVRTIAQEQGFDNHAKKDSTGICFIGERKFKDFLETYIPHQPGDIVSDQGERMGRHQGLMYYTIGQRQGIGIGGCKDGNGEPWYVIGKELDENILRVGQGHHHPDMYRDALSVRHIHWITPPTQLPLTCHAKTRYRQQDQTCTINKSEDGFDIIFNEPQRAITPGQSVVFYQNDHCLGGGIIESSRINQP